MTFAWLEVISLFGDIVESDGIQSFVSGQLIEFAFRFLSESIQNMVKAFIWPLPVVQFSPPYGFLILAAMFLMFGRFMKPPLERWLFGDEGAESTAANERDAPATDKEQETRAGSDNDARG